MNKEQLENQVIKLTAYIDLNVCLNKDWGLCQNVLTDSRWMDTYWDDVFKSWYCFKDCVVYPIEGNQRAYDNNDNKHDRRTTYGKLRLSLAKYCLQHVLNELEKSGE
jgi:hypothetical protein